MPIKYTVGSGRGGDGSSQNSQTSARLQLSPGKNAQRESFEFPFLWGLTEE